MRMSAKMLAHALTASARILRANVLARPARMTHTVGTVMAMASAQMLAWVCTALNPLNVSTVPLSATEVYALHCTTKLMALLALVDHATMACVWSLLLQLRTNATAKCATFPMHAMKLALATLTLVPAPVPLTLAMV